MAGRPVRVGCGMRARIACGFALHARDAQGGVPYDDIELVADVDGLDLAASLLEVDVGDVVARSYKRVTEFRRRQIPDCRVDSV